MRRVFIEKKSGFDAEAQNIRSEIQSYLGIQSVGTVKLITGYDIEGIDTNRIQEILHKVVSSQSFETVTVDSYEAGNSFLFLTKLVPGQFDQQADFLQQLIRLEIPTADVMVQSFKMFVIEGALSAAEKSKIKNYYINPIENIEVAMAAPATLKPNYPAMIKDGTVLGFADMQEAELLQAKETYSLGMNFANLVFTRDYFKKEGKTPTVTELKILDTYWSDHCRHSTFLATLENVEFENDNSAEKQAFDSFMQTHAKVYAGQKRPLCLMDMATLQMKAMKQDGSLTDLEVSDEVNACSLVRDVKVDGEDKKYIIMFKNETHNHPTEIEPFGGASTCLGGGIRDPLSGRAHVFGAMRITGSADPREKYENTLQGKLPQRKITTKAADGYSGYSNQIGLAGNFSQEYYHAGFKAKRMECGGLVAAAEQKNILRENGIPGDVILLIGGKTGRDGCGGATGSSTVQDKDALANSGAEVQKGNPYAQRGIVRLFRKPKAAKLIKKCNDFGAGGISVAVGELAGGLDINLDVVKTKYSGMSGTELAISESQERMAVLIAADNIAEFLTYCAEEDIEATHIATVTGSGRMIMRFNGEVIADIDSAFLNSGGVRETASVKVAAGKTQPTTHGDAFQNWLAAMSNLNVVSNKPIANQFDFSVGGTAAFAPFGGKNARTPEQGLAAVIPLENGNTTSGVLMTVGYNPSMGEQSCFLAGLYSVIEAVSKIVSMGGSYEDIRLSQQEYFESLGKNPEKWGKPFAALLGAFLAEKELNIPAIGGKDSMSGTFYDVSVPPSLLTFALNTIDTKNLVSKAFKKAGSRVVIIKTATDENGVPNFTEYKQNMQGITCLAKSGKLFSSSVVGAGGVAAAVSAMCMGNSIGFKLDDSFKGELFAPKYTDIILEVEDTAMLDGMAYANIGETISEQQIKIGGQTISFADIKKLWENPLKEVFTSCETAAANIPDITSGKTICALRPITRKKPIVLIPIFKSASGEYELEKLFKEAGADTKTAVFKSFAGEDIQNSYTELAENINQSDIIALPAVCQPENESMVKTIFLQADVMAAANALIARGGIILGMGDNFKAIIELGLIDNGKITPNFTSPIALAQNRSGKLFSGLVQAEIISPAQPYFAQINKEPAIIPLSVATASVIIEKEALQSYLAKGQITSLYTMLPENDDLIGQQYNIEGMVSENGQIFACLASRERVNENVYLNVAKQQKSNIFANIVKHFA